MGRASVSAETVRICVVVSTLGARPELRDLLASIAAQRDDVFQVGIADQGASGLVAEIVREFEALPLFVVRTGRRGLSAGRNDVIRAADPGATHFVFPNDTSWYPPEFFARLKHAIETADVGAFSYEDEDGPRQRFRRGGAGNFERSDVFDVIEAGMALSASRARAVGGFDESIGTGSASRRQSGEGTDLLLRVLDDGPAEITWLPGLAIRGVRQNYRLDPAVEARKARGYGFGYGYLLAQWRFPARRLLRASAGPLVHALLGKGHWRVAFATTAGRVEGIVAARRAQGRDGESRADDDS